MLDQIGQLREAHGDLGNRGQAQRGHRRDVELDQQPTGLSLVQVPELGNDFTVELAPLGPSTAQSQT